MENAIHNRISKQLQNSHKNSEFIELTVQSASRICIQLCKSKCCNFRQSELFVEISRYDFHRLKEVGLEKFIVNSSDSPYPVLAEKVDGTCIFLDPESKLCSIYQHRPYACRTFPYNKSELEVQFCDLVGVISDKDKFNAYEKEKFEQIKFEEICDTNYSLEEVHHLEQFYIEKTQSTRRDVQMRMIDSHRWLVQAQIEIYTDNIPSQVQELIKLKLPTTWLVIDVYILIHSEISRFSTILIFNKRKTPAFIRKWDGSWGEFKTILQKIQSTYDFIDHEIIGFHLESGFLKELTYKIKNDESK